MDRDSADTATDGTLKIVDSGVDTRTATGAQEAKELYYRPGTVSVPDLPAGEPLRLEALDFFAAIRRGRPPLVDAHAGIAVVRIIEAAQRSLATNSAAITL
jgi:predicted dehydrogenase